MVKHINKMMKFFLAIDNPNRNKIMEWLHKHKKPIQMRELYKKMGDKDFMSYKSFYQNIKVLEKAELIKLKKNVRASGQSVTIIYNHNLTLNTIIKNGKPY